MHSLNTKREERDVSCVALVNDRFPNKQHLHFMIDGNPIALNRSQITVLERKILSKFPTGGLDVGIKMPENPSEIPTHVEKLDPWKGLQQLRLLGSIKKTGRKSGIYDFDTKMPVSEFTKFCVGYLNDATKLTASQPLLEEYANWDLIRIKRNDKTVRKDNFLSFSNLDVSQKSERVLWVLERLSKLTGSDVLTDFYEWRNAVWAGCNCGLEPDKIDFWMAKFGNYTPGAVQDLCDKFDPKKSRANETFYFKLLKDYCDENDVKEYKKLFFHRKAGGSFDPIQDKIHFFVAGKTSDGDILLAEIASELLKDDVIVETIDATKDVSNIYVWNQEQKLWRHKSIKFLGQQVNNVLREALNVYIQKVKDDLEDNVKSEKSDKKSAKEAKERKQIVDSVVAKCKLSITHCMTLAKSVMVILSRDDVNQLFDSTEKKMLPIANGKKICLITGGIFDRTKEDYYKFASRVSVGDRKNANVRRFFREVMPNKQHRKYLQEVLGYALTGFSDERKFYILYGNANNGKSALMNMLQYILKGHNMPSTYSYSASLPYTVIQKTNVQSNGQEASPQTVKLEGKRFATISEPPQGMELDAPTMKSFVSTDLISARDIFEKTREFRNYATIFIPTNFALNFQYDEALCNRLEIINFCVSFVEKPNIKLGQKLADGPFITNLLENHLDDIFAYFLEGSKRYFARGRMEVPEDLTRMKADLVGDQDTISDFIRQKIQPDVTPNAFVSGKKIYEEYKSFARECGEEKPMTMKTFYSELTSKRGFRKSEKKHSSGTAFVGIKLVINEDAFANVL
jgi:P4 family phage/plasmid primase-like protien